jgi:hypothetical protein
MDAITSPPRPARARSKRNITICLSDEVHDLGKRHAADSFRDFSAWISAVIVDTEARRRERRDS